MPHAEGLYLDKDNNEVTWEDYQKASEEDTGQPPIPQQETVVQEPQAVQQTVQKPPTPTLRASRKPKTTKAVVQQSHVQEKVTEDLKPHASWLRQNWGYLAFGMFVMLVLINVCVSYVYPAYISLTDRWNYGQAKIRHFDFDVGHNGTSHFIAEYWHNQAIIVEFPANHPEKGTTYALRMQPSGDDEPRVVTLRPAYVSQHGKPGWPDLVVQVEGFELPGILYNTGDGFSKEQPS